MAPKVSICIPAYNQVEFLRKTLESIEMQTFQDYEVIITDDSTNEGVQQLVEHYRFAGKLRYKKNEIALGSPENWNEAVRQAKGEYIKIMHHDEWFNHNDSLQEFVEMLDRNPQADFAFSAATGFNIRKNYKWKHSPTVTQLEQLKKDPRCLYFGNFIGPPSSTIYRKSVGLTYDKILKWVVDFDFYIRVLLQNGVFEFSSKELITSVSGALHNVTNECQDNKCVELREYLYLYEKITDSEDNLYVKQYSYFLNKYQVQNTEEIYACGYIGAIPLSIKRSITVNKAFRMKSKIISKAKRVVKRVFARVSLPHPGQAFQKRSYSQAGEDLIIRYIFNELGIVTPSYIDIGAHHPFLLSNTALFYENGSRGINIEPDPKLFKEFIKYRPEDINLNIGISDQVGDLTFYVMSADFLNTFSKEEAEKCQNEQDIQIVDIKTIPVNTLSNVLDKYYNGKFPDLLSLDVEGLDEQILYSINFSDQVPTVICVETISYSNKGDGEKNHTIIRFLESKGYMVYADTNINTIFVKKNKWVRN
jgi:FkbM family methyltransferase